MARDFNGTNQKINFGSDASIDAFASRTVAMWVRLDTATSYAILLAKDGPATNSGFAVSRTFNAQTIDLTHTWDANAAESRWQSNTSLGSVLAHLVVVYSNASPVNNPTMYVNGSTVGVTESSAPGTTADSDAAKNLVSGEGEDGGGDLDGLIGFLCYDNTLWDAAMVNRHRWWGCAPGGPSTVKMWHPLWTGDLNNRGTAAANGTATGSVVDNASVPKVERMWGSMMGCGR